MMMLMVAAVASAQSIDVSGTCPGVVDLSIEGVAPGGSVVLMASPEGGRAAVPAGPCAGSPTDLAARPSRFGPMMADDDGRIELSPELSARQASWLVQAIDVTTCAVSEPVALCGDGGSEVAFTARHERVDLAVVLDTTASMSSWLDGLRDRFPSAAGTLASQLDSLTFGLATYDDYNSASYGTGDDKPFILRQQQTTDADRVSDALLATTLHSGSDGPESGHEALYQAFTGAGYDQDCNGRYSTEDDVFPFLASATDAFGGRVPGTYDPSTPDGGLLGGMGFRDDSLSITVLITDNQLRDPLTGYASPGGCSQDASSDDVIASATELGGRIVGVNVSGFNSIGQEQLEWLAAATGAVADLDGDGIDEPAVYELGEPTAIENVLIHAVDSLAEPAAFPHIRLEIIEDPTRSVQGVAPEAWVDVPGGDDVDFTLSTLGPVVDEVTDYPVTVALVSENYTLLQTTLFIDR